MDPWNELAASSESLRSQIGENCGVAQNLRRGVAELDEASRSLGIGAGNVVQERDQMGAVRLLSRHNFDALQWTRDVNDLTFDGLYRPSERLEATDIDGYLAHNHDLIILSAVDEAKRGAEDDVREISRRWAANEWASSRRQFVESLGHRSQLWSSSALVVKAGNGIPPPGQAPTSTQARTEIQSPYSRSALPAMASATGGAFSAASPVRSSSASTSVNQMVAASVQISDLFRNQAAVVRSLNMGMFKNPPIDRSKPCSDLANTIYVPSGNATDQDGLTRLDLIGYRNLLEMMADMTGEKTSNAALPAKHFSTTCFTSTDVSSAALNELRSFLTHHSLKHLQDQVWSSWSQSVDSAVQQGRLQLPPSNAGESRTQRLRAYVGQLWSNGDIAPTRTMALSPSDSIGREIPVFAFIYHCLRIGETAGAIREVEACLQAGVGNVERELLICLKGFSATSNGQSGALPQGDADALTRAMSACGALYDDERRKAEVDLDPYREHVLNLLSLRDQAGLSETAIPGASLEDFLWGNLWFAQSGGLISRATALGASSRLRASQQGELVLYDQVLKYGGADYFDADRSTPFNYCTVLLCCHRFGEAVLHLWQSGRFLPAVHLLIASLHYGLVLPHVPLTQNPRHGYGDSGIGCNITPASLLEMFFSSALQSSHPELTVDYLISLEVDCTTYVFRVDNNLLDTIRLKCRSSVTSVFQSFLLALGRSQQARIVGAAQSSALPSDSAPFRSRGYLDEYLSVDQINSLLTSCAYHLLSSKKSSEAAMELFSLADRHSEALEELCSRLSSAMSVSSGVTPEEKTFWLQTAEAFYNTHIKIGHSAVLSGLSRDNKLALVGYLETLLNLSVFLDLSHTQPAEALSIIDGLVLFPKVSEEVQAASKHFPTLDPCIRKVADDVIIRCVECAKELYSRLGDSRVGAARGILTDREQERNALRGRVKALVMFAGVIKHRLNRPNTANILARIEDTMS